MAALVMILLIVILVIGYGISAYRKFDASIRQDIHRLFSESVREKPEPRPEVEPATLAAEREKAVAAARAKLGGYPQPVVARFEMLLKAAQTAAVVLKDHNFWIDQRLFYHVRRLILEFGQRLAQPGTLAAASDVSTLAESCICSSAGQLLR